MSGRALWVIGDGSLAGVARHVLDVATVGLPGWELHVVVPEGPLAERLRQMTVNVWSPGFGPEAGVARSLRTVLARARAVDASLLHSHLAWADLVAIIAANRSRIPAISTEHGIAGDPRLYNRDPRSAAVKRQLHGLRLRHTTAVIAVSRSTRDVMTRAWRATPDRIDVIPNGVDPMDTAVSQAGLRVGILSRLSPEKGLDRAVAAFAELHREYPDATLTVAGVGPLRAALEEQVARDGLSRSASFIGYIEPSLFWPGIDVLLQTSLWENCSYSLLDAVVRRRGVVATAVGGNGELLPAQCLVPGDFLPAQAARAMATQGLEVDQRPLLPAEWPTVDEMARGIVDVYESAIDRKRSGIA